MLNTIAHQFLRHLVYRLRRANVPAVYMPGLGTNHAWRQGDTLKVCIRPHIAVVFVEPDDDISKVMAEDIYPVTVDRLDVVRITVDAAILARLQTPGAIAVNLVGIHADRMAERILLNLPPGATLITAEMNLPIPCSGAYNLSDSHSGVGIQCVAEKDPHHTLTHIYFRILYGYLGGTRRPHLLVERKIALLRAERERLTERLENLDASDKHLSGARTRKRQQAADDMLSAAVDAKRESLRQLYNAILSGTIPPYSLPPWMKP